MKVTRFKEVLISMTKTQIIPLATKTGLPWRPINLLTPETPKEEQEVKRKKGIEYPSGMEWRVN